MLLYFARIFELTYLQFYSASFLGDMSEGVALVNNRYPKANVYAVGWSLGANILVRYLGQVFQLTFDILSPFQFQNFLFP